MAKIILDKSEYDRLVNNASRVSSYSEPTYHYGQLGYAEAERNRNGGQGRVGWDSFSEGWEYEHEPDGDG